MTQAASSWWTGPAIVSRFTRKWLVETASLAQYIPAQVPCTSPMMVPIRLGCDRNGAREILESTFSEVLVRGFALTFIFGILPP
jgi:hypothetical protein